MQESRFVVDVMLGSLARWLRLLGYDTLYDNQFTDQQVARISAEERRTVLTRDRRLVRRRLVQDYVLINGVALEDQLRETLACTDPSPSEDRLFTRCLNCNEPLKSVGRQAVKEKVPAYVFKTQKQFRLCSCCDRVYWPGTHRSHALRRLKNLGFDLTPT